MNIILLHDDDFLSADRCVLRDARATHIHTILKSAPGDSLRVGRLDGLLGTAQVTRLEPGSVELAVTLHTPPPAPLPITLALALPRPNMLGRLLRDVASLGVKTLHLFQSERVEKSFWQTPVLQADSVHQKFCEGLAQARDTRLPALHLHRQFRTLLDQQLPEWATTHDLVLADPFSPDATLPASLTRPVVLVVGPEGGFTTAERDSLLAAGCHPLWLGSRILRVETAVITALGHLATRMPLP